MADLILSSIVDNIIGSLGSEAVKEIATLWGVIEDLQALQNTISVINGVLLDAEKKNLHDNGIRIWLENLVDAVDDADELMDELNTRALRRKVMGGNQVSKQVCTFFSAFNQLAFRYKIGLRIREIKKKLDAASKDKNFLLLGGPSSNEERRVSRKRETHSFVIRDEVVGRDEDKEKIIKLLLESRFEERVSVISVVGMGGLGKTTLAQLVFNDETVQNHFELKAWVCVSDPFEMKVILQTITESSGVKLEQLQQKVRQMLGGKRYLLVLDDVWEESREKWLELEMLLRGGAEGSRILVTTRSLKVSKATSLIEPYQLEILDKEKSWSLFKKMAFGKEIVEQEEKNLNLIVIGKEIAEKCRGIPLAIRAIGSTLYSKRLESEWSSFNKNFPKLPQGDDILPILRLSYDNLSSHLKHCFAYCRLFPKDYRIKVQMLIKLWMAQGFLKLSDCGDDQCLEEVGYEYFVDLSERSFFQKIEVDEFGVAKRCKMHDLIHDLAIESAGERYDYINLEPKTVLNKKVRHVSFSRQNSAREILISCPQAQARKIRTILPFDYGDSELDKTTFVSFISNCKQLRTLVLDGIGITVVPSSIGKLKFVRYIDLSWNMSMKTLPKSITNLLNLQTLKLNRCEELQELHRDIKKLVNLRHLEMKYFNRLRHMPVGIGELTNLITLTKFVLPSSSSDTNLRESGELKELMELNNLRGSLAISNLKCGKDAATESKSANLHAKRHLQSLVLKWESNDDGTEEEGSIKGYEMSLESLQPHPNLKTLDLRRYGGAKISSWLQSLTNLVGLSLSYCKNLKHLDPMGQFPFLKRLELYKLPSIEYITKSYSGDDLICSSTASLQVLDLSDLPNLKGWWGDNVVRKDENHHTPLPHFPRLTKLSITNCPNLDCMPLFPHLEEELRLEYASLKPFRQTMLETLD